MRFNDAIIGFILIGFALAEIAYTRTFPRLHGQNYGPDLFPVIIGLGLIACGGILVFKGLVHRTTAPMMEIGDWAKDRGNVLNVMLLLGSIVFYILFSSYLGFIPTSLLILTILMVRLGSSWWASLLTGLATTFIIHGLFVKILLVPLPWGILQPVAW